MRNTTDAKGTSMNAPPRQAEMRAARILADPRWAKVQARDKAADETFVLAVKTTGVFCRPSCSARQPRPENVLFFATPAEAVAAGFRAYKRCRPTEAAPSHAEAVARACNNIETAEEMPTLEALAGQAGLSAHHFHRVFRAATGVTPRAYAAAHRTRRVQAALKTARTVTEAIYDAGFNSGSRFYEGSKASLGMTPSTFRRGGERETIRFAVAPCSLGRVLVGATDKGVCAIFIGDDPDTLARDLQDRFPKAELVAGDAGFDDLVARTVAAIEQPGVDKSLPLDIRGTAFQRRVWEALRAIPAGETASYAQVASRIGAPKAVRAVASACADNPLAVAIPCHRVVRTGGDGAKGNYRWGVARKRALLAREKQA